MKINRIQLIVLTVAFLVAALVVYWIFKDTPMVRGGKVRGQDPKGSGHYLASRGGRPHLGVDLVTKPGQKIYAPFSGTITRHPFPYAGDTSYKGIELKNAMNKLKAFYVVPAVQKGTKVRAGQLIGHSQNISAKYGGESGGMINHIHVELYDKHNRNIDPTKYVI